MFVSAARFYLQAMGSFNYSRTQLRELQQRKLAAILRYAFDFVPFYRAEFQKIGKTPDDIHSIEDVRLLPTMTKADVVENYPARLLPRNAGPALVMSTSGSTGRPSRMAYSQEQRDVGVALAFRRYTKFGMRPWHRVVSVWPPNPQWRYELDGENKRRVSAPYLNLPLLSFFGHPTPILRILKTRPEDISADARELHELRPDFIVCRTSHLRRLGLELEKQGLEVHPKGLLCTGEGMTPTTMGELKRFFRAPVLRMYGASEFGTIGGECPAERGIHLNEDYMMFEVLRDGEQVGPGEMGELVITSFHNKVLPLIRYRTRDYVELADDGVCDCGSSLMRLKTIQGRIGDGMLTVDGSRIPPLSLADEVESKIGLHDFQLVQTGPSEVNVRLRREDVDDQDAVNKLRLLLEELVGCDLRLKVEARTDEDIWMKGRPVISLVKQ